jgi:hypothetical protein
MKSKPLPDCEMCRLLWRDYFQATTSHISLDSKLRLAALERDVERVAGLTLEVLTAELARDTAYDSLRKHKAEPHSLSASADA